MSCNRLLTCKSLLEDETYQIDSAERASIDRVCSEGENSNSVEQDSYSNFQVYHSRLNMSHQLSHFNVLTHQDIFKHHMPFHQVRLKKVKMTFYLLILKAWIERTLHLRQVGGKVILAGRFQKRNNYSNF